MCLILAARNVHSRYPMIIAANRDEFYDRPSAPLDWWKDRPEILAGRDLKSGGTWMGVTLNGRFAAVTNYRNPQRHLADAPSRGLLVNGFLIAAVSAPDYIESLSKKALKFNNFNIMVHDGQKLIWFSNQNKVPVELDSGVYALSNSLLDTPWPKVEKGKRGLQEALELSGDALIENLLTLLQKRESAPDSELPNTGVDLEWERILSPIFITSPGYGTRSSSVILFDQNGEITFAEQSFENGQKSGAPLRFSYQTVRARHAVPLRG
ncbi:MAG: NRDE family protein [Proteobacteria bacterium]|nr:NRDE family protein [Pseudomonadota bacterium]